MMNRAYSLLEVKQVDDDKRIITGTATSPSPDRIGDIVEPLGVKYKNPLPLLWHHQSNQPVGTVTFDKPTKKGITFTAKLPIIDVAGPLKDRVDTAWGEVKAGLVRGVSIGFRSLESSRMEDGGLRFIESEVLELSLVTIPANADATIDRIKSVDTALLAATGQSEAYVPTPTGRIPVAATSAGATASTHVVKAKEAKRAMSKRSIADAISSFEATVVAKKTEMDALMAKSIEDGETLSAEDDEKYKAAKGEMEAASAHVVRLKEHDALNRETAAEVKGADPVQASHSRALPAQVRATPKPLGDGTGFIRFVQCLVNAKGNLMMAERMAVERASQWDIETPDVIPCIKAAVAAGSTTDSTWAGPLVNYQILASEFIEYLRPRTILGRIPGLRRVPFKVKVPRQTGGATVSWVGERSVKPVSSLAFDTVTLEFSKIAGIIVISDELAKFSNPSAEAIIRQDLGDSIIQYMDSQFTDPTVAAVTNLSPASITNGVTPVTASGTTAAALRTDLLNVLNNFTANNITLAGLVGIMTESQALAISMMQTSLGNPAFPSLGATGGSLNGIPIVTSENISATGGSPTDGYPIIFLRARDILLADDGMVTVDASNQASLQMDSAPTSPPTTDTVMFSLWQNNCTGLRAERFVNWGKARSTSVEYISNGKYAE